MRNLSYSYWTGLLASLIAITTPFIPVVRESKYEILYSLVISLIAVLFVLRENLYLKKHWRRKKKYPEIFGTLNEAMAALDQLDSIRKPNNAQIKSCFIQFSTKLAEAFSKVTNGRSSVSIKILEDDFKTHHYDARIGNFVRDNTSFSTRSNPTYQSPMTIEENTDFKEICQNLRYGHEHIGHFFSNNLLKDALKGYKNSRFGHEFYEVIKRKNNAEGYRLLKQIWSLEYRSSIVVAIYPLNPDKEYELIGFLCIDSPNFNAYLDCDIDILYGFGAALFKYRDLIKACYDALDPQDIPCGDEISPQLAVL
jgi:hypothetical protein